MDGTELNLIRCPPPLRLRSAVLARQCHQLTVAVLLFISLLCIRGGSVLAAAGGPDPAHDCRREPRCLDIVREALAATKTSKEEALRLMLKAYGDSGDPRLCFNLGRLYQQLGQPVEAVRHFRLFLESGVELDPEQLSKAHKYLEQAEQDAQQASPAPPPEPQAPLPPAALDLPGIAEAARAAEPVQRVRRAERPTWRIALGSVMIGAGVLAAGFAIAALSQDGKCTQGSSAAVAMPPCLASLHTSDVGAVLLTSGLAAAGAGVLIIAIPPRKEPARVAEPLVNPTPDKVGY